MTDGRTDGRTPHDGIGCTIRSIARRKPIIVQYKLSVPPEQEKITRSVMNHCSFSVYISL